mgnify:CR=1 FL=1
MDYPDEFVSDEGPIIAAMVEECGGFTQIEALAQSELADDIKNKSREIIDHFMATSGNDLMLM